MPCGQRLLLRGGDGTFAAKVEYPTGRDPRAIAVLDVNGDSMPDLAVANRDDSTVTILLNVCGE